ncbi:hypothetical protein [Actinoplanes sp. GCM10030250]|uniref:hypothetical protein n=1 Tax=Actinoplanes sp. GCM10030250 TaxID=3273376 RepID=UPI00361C15EE
MTDHHWDDDFDLPDDVPDIDHHDLPEPEHDVLGSEHWEAPEEPELPDWADPEVADVPDSTFEDDVVFPPTLDVGDLPEPVDGFPWIDTGTLGVADADGFTPVEEQVNPGELAAYAGVDLPAGADPWAALAADEDPATSALARWWTPGEQ